LKYVNESDPKELNGSDFFLRTDHYNKIEFNDLSMTKESL